MSDEKHQQDQQINRIWAALRKLYGAHRALRATVIGQDGRNGIRRDYQELYAYTHERTREFHEKLNQVRLGLQNRPTRTEFEKLRINLEEEMNILNEKLSGTLDRFNERMEADEKAERHRRREWFKWAVTTGIMFFGMLGIDRALEAIL